jgi:hypothetical protein
MPNCSSSIAGSVLLDCLNGNGGIDEIKIKAYDSTLTGITVTSGVATLAGAALSGWKLFECEEETSMFDDAGATSSTEGTTVYTQTLTYINNKLKASFRNTLNNLHGMRLHIAVKDNNGLVWLLGYERGMITSASSATTGTAFNERNGYTVTFTGREKQPKVSVSNSWTALIDA